MITKGKNMRLKLSLTSAILFLTSAGVSNAHVGHLGEVAGHAHWIGLGAVVVAGAIAVAVGKLSDKKGDADEKEPEAEAAEETVA